VLLPKPEPRKRVKSRNDRQRAALRKRCVDAVWSRANAHCQDCGRPVCKPRETDNPFDVGHVHEIVPRSLGGDATDPENCRLLCVTDHMKAHGQRVAS
jgi:5-methylcytosine-specific restriction endonuclease McrA